MTGTAEVQVRLSRGAWLAPISMVIRPDTSLAAIRAVATGFVQGDPYLEEIPMEPVE